MKKAFDIAMIVFGFVCVLVLLGVIPRIFAHSGPVAGWATIGLVIGTLIGLFVGLSELRKRGRIDW